MIESSPLVWENDVRVLESDESARQLITPIVFTGSSTIRMWPSLSNDFAPLTVLNRGFGGAQMDAILYYAPRLVLAHAPAGVVLYGGENDLEAYTGKKPEDVMASVEGFADLIAASAPRARLYLISIKPSPARVEDWPSASRFNMLLRSFAEKDRRRTYVDVATPSFDAAGQRRRELYLDDGLHLSRAGYELWRSVLRPILMRDLHPT